MPTLLVDGQGIFSALSTRKHIGIYPHSGSVVQRYAEPLRALGVPTTKGAIQLPDGVTLPERLLAGIVRTRLAELGR